MSTTRAAISAGPGYWRSATLSLPVALVVQYALVVAIDAILDRVTMAAIAASVIMFGAALAFSRSTTPTIRGCAPGIIAAIVCFWAAA
ncbi:hypothetical protein [Nocardia sp. NPDC056100]|uniref:hypothetical protein n=1 Tax=Nocardia sp. NPDC056100 TaxID=3345712 RepID=UPI0035D979FA